jgi:hypothetical protein
MTVNKKTFAVKTLRSAGLMSMQAANGFAV